MAIATGTAIALGISAAASGVQMASGISRKRKAKRALENFKRQDLKNVTKDLKVSTLGAELQAQEQARRFSTSVDALRSGGVRGVVGGLGRQEQLQQLGTQRISADLDRQQMAIDRMAAQDEAKIRDMQELRESGAVSGLGKEIASADAQLQQGAMGLAKSAASAATFIPGTVGGGKGIEDAVDVVNTGAKATQELVNSSTNLIPASGGGGGVVDVGAGFFDLNTNPLDPTLSGSGTAGLRFKGITGPVGTVYGEASDFGNFIGDLDSIPKSAFNVNNPVHGVKSRY